MHLRQVTVRGFRAGAEEDLTCTFPGRFSLLVGANNAGKSTICEAIYLAHANAFPTLRRPSAAALRPAKDGPRELEVAYAYASEADTEGPLGNALVGAAVKEPSWTKALERSLGKIRVRGADEGTDGLRVVYLPAYRNPVDELARRQAEVLIELLRAEQQRLAGHRNLHGLRSRAEGLLTTLSNDPIIQAVEGRIQAVMADLTGGIGRQYPFIGGQVVDDQFLARVLEILLAPEFSRALAQRLELSGLGYANLLHLAVTIAAIPDLTAEPPSATPPVDGMDDEPLIVETRVEMDDANERGEANEDSFWKDTFHATLVIEEPEAHLHPQLQHGLVRFLQRAVRTRPELQVVISSHAGDLISACKPSELVVLRRTIHGRRSFVVGDLPGAAKARRTLRMAELHLDVTRSASLFAERLIIVEGISDALLVRQFGRHWAGSDGEKQQFLDALTVLPIGSKVGEWPVHLLASTGFELVVRLAVLTDSDDRTDAVPTAPDWTTLYASDVFLYRNCHPTLEPAIAVPGNADVIRDALEAAGIAVPPTVNADSMDELFKTKPKDSTSSFAGNGASKKGDFALHLAALLAERSDAEVPAPIADVLDFVFEGFALTASADAQRQTDLVSDGDGDSEDDDDASPTE